MIALIALETWLALAVKGVVVLTAALAVTWLLRGRTAATRHLVLAAALCALLLLPLAARMVPSIPLTIPAWAASATGDARQFAHQEATVATSERHVPALPRETPRREAGARAESRADLGPFLVGAWLLGVLALSIRTASGLLASRRIVADATPIVSERWLRRLESAALELGALGPFGWWRRGACRCR